jgi:hypothetical protein
MFFAHLSYHCILLSVISVVGSRPNFINFSYISNKLGKKPGPPIIHQLHHDIIPDKKVSESRSLFILAEIFICCIG